MFGYGILWIVGGVFVGVDEMVGVEGRGGGECEGVFVEFAATVGGGGVMGMIWDGGGEVF